MIDYVKIDLDRTLMERYVKDGRRKGSTIIKKSRDSREETYLYWMHNLLLKVTPNNATLEGSLHGFYNALHGNVSYNKKHKWVNYNDFTYSNLLEVINWLGNKLSYDISKTDIRLCEFGFNLKLDIPPKEFIDNYILMYKFREPCYDPKYKKDMKFKKFDLENYYVKIYDKSLQFNLKENILRIEVGFKTDELRERKIESLKDLANPDRLEGLFSRFSSIYERLLIVDSFDGCNTMPRKERQKMIKYTNQHYWKELLENSRYSSRCYHNLKLRGLISQYNLDNKKIYLERLISKEYRYLLYN